MSKKIREFLIGIVNFGDITRKTYSDDKGKVRYVIHENDKSGHRKYTLKYEDLCQ